MINRFRKAIAVVAAVASRGAVAVIPTEANAWWYNGGGHHYHFNNWGYGGVRIISPGYGYNNGYNGGCLRVRNVVDYSGYVIGTKVVNVCY